MFRQNKTAYLICFFLLANLIGELFLTQPVVSKKKQRKSSIIRAYNPNLVKLGQAFLKY